MVIPILDHVYHEGLSSIPYAYPVLKIGAYLSGIAILKRYFGGARNKSTRVMHSKVVIVTGGTSGIGAAVVRDLASRGAQIILLTKHSPSDPFLVDYIEDLRSSTGNRLIYAEQVDLSSLHSIRLFATKWVDNAIPRRLDMIILCANTMSSPNRSSLTVDRLNEEWQVNYLANYHLLSILSPALRAQPPDRDVRVIFSTCSSYIGAKLDFECLEEATTTSKSGGSTHSRTTRSSSSSDKKNSSEKPTKIKSTKSSTDLNMYATSKLALMIFAHSFQQNLSSYNRPDKHPPNVRVLLVDPGLSRTPGTRAWLTRGSLWGLLLYLLTWPFWWLVLKSPEQGAQSFLMAAMEGGFSAVGGGVDGLGVADAEGKPKIGIAGRKLIKECKEREILRKEIGDDYDVGKKLWEFSQVQIEKKEKEGAVRRAVEKKEREMEEAKKGKEKKENGKPEWQGTRAKTKLRSEK
ncbi:hypothetical protein VTO42DRAFT_8479 [Malbranchea cinnamomea]